MDVILLCYNLFPALLQEIDKECHSQTVQEVRKQACVFYPVFRGAVRQ